MDPVLLIVGGLIWSLIVAAFAKLKFDRSFWGWLIFSILVTPLVTSFVLSKKEKD